MPKAVKNSRSCRTHRSLSNSRNHLARRDVFHRRLVCEALEDRRLLSGVTLITHGFGADVSDWVTAMANAVFARPDLNIDQPRYVVKATDGGNSANPISVSQVSHIGPSPTASTTDFPEIMILLDWSDMAGSVTLSHARSTVDIATAVVNALVAPNFLSDLATPLVELPLHLIGHSRGASLVGELAKDLGMKGIWVDQVTTLDPHPLKGGLSDPLYPSVIDAPMNAWSNVTFWDNYWENSHPYPHGESIPGTYDKYLTNLNGGYNGVVGPGDHGDVHLWYHGTIDTTDPISDNNVNNFSASANGWYGGSNPSRTTSGYYYSRIVGGMRPNDGISTLIGGGGSRQTVSVTESAWPNIINFAIDPLDVRVDFGDKVHVTYWYQDFDSNAETTFYLDADQNPYNSNAITTNLPLIEQKTGANPWSDGFNISTDNALANTSYYVCAKISDGTHTRYAYAPGKVTVGPSLPGTDLSIGTVVWDDRLPNGDDDGVMEAGETVRVQVPLYSSAAVKNVNATIITTTGGITITPVDVYYGDFTSGQTKLPDNTWNNIFLNITLPSGQTTMSGFALNITYEKNYIHYTQTQTFTKLLYGPGDYRTFTVPSSDMQDPLSLCDRNNGDNLLQTGEQIYLVPRIQLNGTGVAKNVSATLIYSGTNLIVGSNTLSYGDLTPGQPTLPRSGHFWIATNNFTFTGIESIDVQLQWDTGTGPSTPLVLPGAIRLTVNPAAVLDVTLDGYQGTWDFGIVAPGTPVTKTLRITNRGTAQMNVTNVTTSAADTTVSGGTSFSLAPQGWRDLTVTVNTSAILSGTTISRLIRVISTDASGPGGYTRLSDAGAQSDRMTITGLVSNTVPIYPISLAPSASSPDVSLPWVVYQDGRYGNSDIFAYNIVTGVERRITTNTAEQVQNS